MTTSAARSMLPPLSQEEQRHGEALRTLIRERLDAAGGWLPFEAYMELALYAPRLGYYSAGSHKIGSGGDFVTAPEVSGLFARCVARQCAQLMPRGGGDILELGAGTGRLAAGLLAALDAQERLPRRYLILEVSADLAQRQRALLDGLPARLRERVSWLEGLPAAPFSGIVLANEVADALPCRRFSLRGGQVREVGVAAAADGSFHDAETDPDAALRAQCTALLDALAAPLPEGYSSEVCLRAGPWVASLADTLAAGAILLFDYGLPRRHYYHPQRTQGTLRCHFRQRVHDDPYINLGVQDITAWVDFTRLAEAAVHSELSVAGFCTQAAFLLASGLEEFVSAADGELERARLAGEARRLVMPEEMGEAFKVMALTRGLDEPPAGFALQDLRHLL